MTALMARSSGDRASMRRRQDELQEMAETYREMAATARSAAMRLEFRERAERYETAAWAVKRGDDGRRKPPGKGG